MQNFITGLLIAFNLTTQATSTPLESQKLPVVERNDINLIITRKAFVYGVDEELMHEIVKCESQYNTNAVNISPRERSYGLVQINTLAHDIEISQATDPEFAIDFLAKNIKKGKAKQMWTVCYNRAIKGV